ncbi:uncharacterized protein LOC125650973 isoform X3 [Ostrea edulis]|uniref:uncharacterized protein LOC125650973 isoform X3 n=1 Tax=Ostrea edulis TaxID=37623 RepID=UPI0020951F71|nr:uncharacterized protein LOC125650973 isoform X3 [Ostrea edulis]
MMTMDMEPPNDFLHGLNRIRCNGSRIMVGNRDFTSASEALEAYLDQYAGLTSKHKGRYRQNVSDLLDPKSPLHQTAERSLQTGIRDTAAELKLASARDSINESYDKMKRSMALRAEGYGQVHRVDEALNKSGELLQRIANDEALPKDGPSDIESMNTDTLINMNLETAGQKRGHVYSYKNPRHRSKTVGAAPRKRDLSSVEDILGSRRSGLANLPPPMSYKSSQPRERSRSISPSSFRHHERLASNPARQAYDIPVKSYDLDLSQTKKPPSWIDALDISNPSESFWSKRDLVSGRPAPSWIHGLDKSDITGVTADLPQKRVGFSEKVAKSSFDRSHDSNPPGLDFNDLLSKSPGKSSLKSPKSGRKAYNFSSKLAPEVLNAGNTSANSSDILEKYLDTSTKGDNSFEISRRPRCSSLDTEALLAGISAPNKSDITGASPITPVKSPTQTRGSNRPQSPDTDMVLDGDRSWEKPVAPSLKPVVFTENDNLQTNTLTGTPQPGSLEALKNMLFKLQTEAAAHAAGNPTTVENLQSGVPSAGKLEDDIPALKGYNWQEQPGGQSLEKALLHLGNLKTIVNNEKVARSRSPSPHRMRSRSHSPGRPRTPLS